MQYSKAAYGPIPARLQGVNRNADNGWGGYEWTEDGSKRVPERLIGVASGRNTLGDPLRIRIRRELVPLTELMWQIAVEVDYCIHSTNPNGNGEPWGPWGGEDRPMGGTKVASNHSRFRAEDDNAPYNPMVSSFITDMDPQYVAARELCGFYWGGRYNGKTDTMHFEYVGRPEDVAADERRARQILEALRARHTTPSKPATPASPTAPAPAPTPIPEEDDMPYTPEQLEEFARRGALRAMQSDEGLAATRRAATEAVTDVSVSQGFANADAFSAEEKAGVITAVAEALRSEGVSGAGDLGRWQEAIVPVLVDKLGDLPGVPNDQIAGIVAQALAAAGAKAAA